MKVQHEYKMEIKTLLASAYVYNHTVNNSEKNSTEFQVTKPLSIS